MAKPEQTQHPRAGRPPTLPSTRGFIFLPEPSFFRIHNVANRRRMKIRG